MSCPKCHCADCLRRFAKKKARKQYLNDGQPAGSWEKTQAKANARINNRLALKRKHRAYLKTTLWKITRDAALARDNNRCCVCTSPDSLHVHHATYVRLGNERPGDLITLCQTCHDLTHRGAINHVQMMCGRCGEQVFQPEGAGTCRLCGSDGIAPVTATRKPRKPTVSKTITPQRKAALIKNQ